MKSVLIKGQNRESLGKKDSKKLRNEQLVPCVLYGGDQPVHFSAAFSDFRSIIYTPNVYLIDLDIEGKTYKAIIKATQWHSVEEQLLHVDFLLVKDDKPVKIDIPVKTIGMAAGMRQGGKLKTNIRKLKVKALAKYLPDIIELNIEELGIGQSIKVGDLNYENLEFLDTKSNVIVTVEVTRAARAAMEAETGKK